MLDFVGNRPTTNSFNSKTVNFNFNSKTVNFNLCLVIFSVTILNYWIFFIYTPKYYNYKTDNKLETSKEQLITTLNDFQSISLFPHYNHHTSLEGAINSQSKNLCEASSASLSQEVPLNKHVNTSHVRKSSINTTFLGVPILHDFQEAEYHEQYINDTKSRKGIVSWNISENNGRLWDDDSAFLYNDKNSTIIAINKNNSMTKGLYLFHNSTRFISYPHVLLDHLNILAWLRDNAPIRTKFILQESEPFKSLLEELDPFFVADRVIWVPRREKSNIITVNGTLFTLMTDFYRRLPFYNSLRRWIWERQLISSSANLNHTMNNIMDNTAIGNSSSSNNIQSRYILYLSRNSSTVNHGRKVHPPHEIDILNIIRQQMKKYQRKESLLIFRGEKANGDAMTLKEQASLFASAQVVIGPHGGAMSNIIWMGLTQEFCYDDDHDDVQISRQRPQVLEFLIGPGSKEFQLRNEKINKKKTFRKTFYKKVLEFLIGPGSQEVQGKTKERKERMFSKTFYKIYHRAPWVEYHHLLYAPKSTNERLFVNLTEFRLALDDMWSH